MVTTGPQSERGGNRRELSPDVADEARLGVVIGEVGIVKLAVGHVGLWVRAAQKADGDLITACSRRERCLVDVRTRHRGEASGDQRLYRV
jgi:hypothetical protein